jgi:[protein-PII] uridylyltransferase
MASPMLAVQELRADFRSKQGALLATLGASVASTRGSKTLHGAVDAGRHRRCDACGSRPAARCIRAGGRRRLMAAAELFPHSDVDVLLLLPDMTSPTTDRS